MNVASDVDESEKHAWEDEAERLRAYFRGAAPTEALVRKAFALHDAIDDRVRVVTDLVLKARGSALSQWDVTSWEVTTNRERVEVLDVTTSYWFHGDGHPST